MSFRYCKVKTPQTPEPKGDTGKAGAKVTVALQLPVNLLGFYDRAPGSVERGS